jgi:hypothetical protein
MAADAARAITKSQSMFATSIVPLSELGHRQGVGCRTVVSVRFPAQERARKSFSLSPYLRARPNGRADLHGRRAFRRPAAHDHR